MEANFKQTTTDKEERYSLFLPQFELLISNEKEEVSVLANACAALHEAFGFFWVGFYLVKNDKLIRLLPYPQRKRSMRNFMG
jgi:L-methionine (R)-S-oxide reductase